MDKLYFFKAKTTFVFFFFFSGISSFWAATNTASGGTTWANTTWSLGHLPDATEDAVIPSGLNLSIDNAAVCGSLTIGDATVSNTTLTIGAGGSLVISGTTGDLTMNPQNTAADFILDVGTQIFTMDGTPIISSTGANEIKISTGTLNFTKTTGLTWSTETIRMTGAGNINFTGPLTQSGGTIVNTTAAGTISFNGGYSRTSGAFTTMSGEVLNFGNDFSNSGTALTLNVNSTAVFTGTVSIIPTTAITFGSLTIQNTASVTLSGNISVKKNWANNGGIFIPGTNSVTFNALVSQFISTAETFYDLTVNVGADPAGGVILSGGNVTINNTLTLTDGKIFLGNFDLYISSGNAIAGYGSAKYIVTNGTGTLGINNVGGASKVFPIGPNTPGDVGVDTTYTPLTISNSGTADRFNVRAIQNVYSEGTTGFAQPDKVVSNTWLISEGTAGGSDLTITAEWDAAQEKSFNRGSCQISQYDAGTGQWDNPVSFAAAGGSNPYTRSRTSITDNLSSTPFAVESDVHVLPIELFDFKGVYNDETVYFFWRTITETNNDYFSIERSTDGIHFENVVNIDGAGNSIEEKYYETFDPSPLSENSYYRLKQTDFNGDYSYSEMIAIAIQEYNSSYTIYPNPSQGIFNISFGSINTGEKIFIYDVWGRFCVYEKIADSFSEPPGIFSLDLSYLSDGTYFLQILTEKDAGTQKIILKKE